MLPTRTRNLHRDEHGVSVVIGAMLVISLIFIAMSVYVSRVVPGEERKNEADHMYKVRGVFLDLHAAILNNETTTLDLPMAAEQVTFGPPPESSRLTITPARAVKRFEPVADAYVDEVNNTTNYGGDNFLWVKSYTGNNRRSYLKFDLTNELENVSPDIVVKAWLVLYCENVSGFMGAPWGIPEYDVYHSADWSQTDWSGGPGQTQWLDEENFFSSNNIDWENFPGELRLQFDAGGNYYESGELTSSIYDAGSTDALWGINREIGVWPSDEVNIYVYVRFDNDAEMAGATDWMEIYNNRRFDFGTVSAQYAQYRVTLTTGDNQQTPVFKELRLFNVEVDYLPTLPILVEVRGAPNTWSEDNITWDNQPSPLGDTIKALEWPNEDNHGITENEVWYTWDVTTWVCDRLEAGDNASFLLKAAYENSTIDRYATFSSENREGLEWGWSVKAGDDYLYPDPHLPPYPKPHLTIIYENWVDDRLYPGAPCYDNWGAFIEGGSIRLDTNYRNFPAHNFTFESGALIQQQWGHAYELMIAEPGIVVGERRTDNNINVYVNRYRIVNRDRLTTSADLKLKVTVRENTDYSWGGHLENVLITINTDFEWPWKYWLRDITGTKKGFNAGNWEGGLKDYIYNPELEDDQSHGTADFQSKFYVDRNVRMYIFGLRWDPNVSDIYYYDRTYDVEVEAIV